jgi:membrane-bound lytic murein transglycosylase B
MICENCRGEIDATQSKYGASSEEGRLGYYHATWGGCVQSLAARIGPAIPMQKLASEPPPLEPHRRPGYYWVRFANAFRVATSWEISRYYGAGLWEFCGKHHADQDLAEIGERIPDHA